MINKLRTRLVLLILGGAVCSIALVSIITNITLFRNFDLYMRNEQQNRIAEVMQLIEQSYGLTDNWTEETIDNIRTSPLIYNFDIEIRDQDNKLIFTNYMESTMIQMHNEMMGRMGHGMMGRMGHGMMGRNHPSLTDNNLRDENYILQQYEILSENKKVGIATIGHMGPFVVSEREIEFTRGMNISIFYGAIISAITVIFIGLYSSKIFSQPILKITETANQIREGNLDIEVDESNNIVELQELSKSINHLSKSLNEQKLLRKRLTLDISHELRTPLTILQGHIEAMSDGIWEPTSERLALCNNEVIRLIKLVEGLKYLTDIENHRLDLEFQQYSLSKDLNEIIEGLRYQFQEKGITVNTDIEKNIYMYGDKDKIRQVIINLLVNALKFTNAGDIVNVELAEETEQIKIIIEDSGVGIDASDLPYIFERFYRSDESRNRKTGGAGIGLTITKTLIEAQGGKITVNSVKGKGTKFTIFFTKKERIQHE